MQTQPEIEAFRGGSQDNPVNENGKRVEDKGKGKIKHLHVNVLDDGSFQLDAHTDKGHSFSSSHQNAEGVMAALKDHLTSPHLPKLGSGERFAKLKNELAGKPGIYNPAGLAAYIGMKRYGKAKFESLAAKGRKRNE